jgi:bifunctional lysine-specific demethylase and histidyl-hydroxylase NO66
VTIRTEPPTVVAVGWASRLCAGDPRSFAGQTWGRKASIFVEAPALDAQDLLSLDDVDRILSTMSLRTPMFRLVKAGSSIPESAYTRSGRTGSKPVTGIADPRRIFALFDDGATIVLQGLHRYWEPVARLARDLELELGHPCQVNAYVTPPGAAGLALHSDPHDVFVVQTFGRKHWEIHAAPRERARAPLEAVLEAGDCIYMPTGTPHMAATQETLSGHLTIGVNAVTWRDVMADALEGLAAADPSLGEALPPGWTDDREAIASELRSRLSLLPGSIDRVATSEIVDARADAFLSSRLPTVRGALTDRMSLAGLDDDTLLRRRPGTICEVRRAGDVLQVLLGDRRLEMPVWLEPAMRRLASVDVFSVGELASELPDQGSRLVLARRLVREALFAIDR